MPTSNIQAKSPLRLFLGGLFSRESKGTIDPMQFTSSDLSFDELNPLLAKQLSELEMQIGLLVRTQSEMADERVRIRHEMDAIKRAFKNSELVDSQAPAKTNP